jgi:hypothetical protein
MNNLEIDNEQYDDNYPIELLIRRYTTYREQYIELKFINERYGISIRQQNPPEDITENIVKYIIRKYENDNTCIWCKGVNKKYKLKGDLYSNNYDKNYPIEVKSFTSDGPSQFGPNKKFGKLYFLDLRNWLNNIIILWKVNLSNESETFKNIKMNKNQTHKEQCDEKRRPHISWDKLYPQIHEYCEKIYEGSFDEIIN